ncbi:MAG: hypothetical protein RLZ45_2748 [Verrucomicrobiota bacterium]|jgi:ABC-type uncharacterized transport system involved in gliding motility auxiliary subunit
MRTAMNVIVAVMALVVVVGLLNHLSVSRRVWRVDLSTARSEPLSDLTRQTLAAQTNEVRVTVLFDPSSDLYPHVMGLLRDYEALSPRIRVQTIDYLRDPAAGLKVAGQFQLGAGAKDLVVFESGNRHRVVTSGELSVYDTGNLRALVSGEERDVRRVGFTGEYHFTSAIAALVDAGETHACYLLGHGEHPPDGKDKGVGYAAFLELLRGQKNLTVDVIRLAGATNQIPKNCELLVVAGPTAPLLPGELQKIEAFLQRGGRLLVLLHPYTVEKSTGLEELLARWGIAAPPAYAGDDQFTSYTKLDVLSQNFGGHAIVSPLRRSGGALYFPLPRVVAPMPAQQMPADAPKADVLVKTSASGMTRSNVKDGNAAFDPARDVRNQEIPIAVAAEKGGVSGIAAGRGTTRIVAIGDSTMMTNETLDEPRELAGNRDFANMVVGWLLDRPQSLAIGPRRIREYRLVLTSRQRQVLSWTVIAGLPGAILLMGLAIWYRRRI